MFFVNIVRLRTPPRVKVLEALGAVAGKRVKILDQNNCLVDASEGPRTYNVFVDLSSQLAQSDDNGTVFRDYVGYPIIAFLMVLGKISYDQKIAELLASVKWRSLNERYKSYAKVESVVKDMLAKQGVKPEEVEEFVAKVLQEVEQLGLRKRVI